MKTFQDFLKEKKAELESVIVDIDTNILVPALKHIEETTPNVVIKNTQR